ncbi:MAG: rhomboid family intramembrane serine protease [Saprospiraceae bacterium]|jgi:membrane associated rhomboid family serine protease|nr:rhomboid family intramembrane serine protease [Saprospiraceae bacterium]MBK6480432.1 rhomboid family intramembrane serine protease [Saprospiraceae bacterium]MBK6817196.1 rhomboid family intramembrane serine protease [Saprospiraceae bacterium]MBK7371747.1 rhomboid family intramembrane serine protease [Saprospiraceae bacterium]MBK7435776.1 rhomboid family intramembrane serine protease [Saprospiraceae bacterium]
MKSSRIVFSIRNTLFVLGAMWIGFLIQALPFFNTTNWGIIPRYTESLKGILTAPLMHGGWSHILSNSAPMAVLCLMLFYFYRKIAWISFSLIYFLCGLSVWLFARSSAVHIGASGVVYGLVAFIFWNGIFRKDLKSIILLLIVTILYSGMLYGIVPSQPGISWESHLFGGIMGILVAFMMRRFEIREDDDIELQTPKPLSEADKEYYFEKDIFDQKLKEREPQNRRL